MKLIIPDNATNGDAIKALFPKSKIHVIKSLGSVNIVTDDTLNAQTVDIEWWNAPYKESEE